MERIFGISAIALALTGVDAGKCKPVTMIQTRATGDASDFDEGNKTWTPKYPLGNANTASVNGAFYYIIAETIDKETGYSKDGEKECERKSNVSYIHFYKITMCNPDDALWWFEQRASGVKGDPAFNLGEYGQYLTFDAGTCSGDKQYCNYLTGEGDKPDLGSFVGWQDQTNGERNPTEQSYWYSLPGDCPQLDWSAKTDKCIADHPGGLCAPGDTPDGEKCTWSYELMGEVSLDKLIGITDEKKANGDKFESAKEYCQANKTEFLRDPKTYEMEEGLPFWDKPLSQEKNAKRVELLLEHYKTYPNNLKLPTSAELKNSNPRCYESTPGCFADGKEICTRNDEQLCVPCEEVEGGCADDADESKAFPQLPEYEEVVATTDVEWKTDAPTMKAPVAAPAPEVATLSPVTPSPTNQTTATTQSPVGAGLEFEPGEASQPVAPEQPNGSAHSRVALSWGLAGGFTALQLLLMCV